MCLIAFAWAPGTHRPLVLASNRDEFWQRPTEALDSWVLPQGHRVYGGRDVTAGGTWIGFSEHGRVALVTNVRRWPPDTAARSRGELASAWLDTTLPWADWLALHPAHTYGGVNLVLGQVAQGLGDQPPHPDWVWLTNRQPEPDVVANALGHGWWGRVLIPGLYGLSNAALDTPWPKTLALKHALGQALDLPPNSRNGHDAVLQALLNTEAAPTNTLPRTGVPPDLERLLSAAFVHDPERGYGTRSSLIAVADRTGLHLQEWTHNVQAHPLPHHHRPPAWPVAHSVYRERSISTWGMPTSS